VKRPAVGILTILYSQLLPGLPFPLKCHLTFLPADLVSSSLYMTSARHARTQGNWLAAFIVCCRFSTAWSQQICQNLPASWASLNLWDPPYRLARSAALHNTLSHSGCRSRGRYVGSCSPEATNLAPRLPMRKPSALQIRCQFKV
jgi:hypothetical protein